MRIGLTDYDDEVLVTGMALELLLGEDPSDFSEKNACYPLDIKF
jgi:hypothetical protein